MDYGEGVRAATAEAVALSLKAVIREAEYVHEHQLAARGSNGADVSGRRHCCARTAVQSLLAIPGDERNRDGHSANEADLCRSGGRSRIFAGNHGSGKCFQSS